MNKNLILVALRSGALYLEPQRPTITPADPEKPDQLTKSTIYSLQELILHGYTLDEKALHMFNRLDPADQADVLSVISDVSGDNLNWTPLVKGWYEPTNEGYVDHLLTAFYNIFVSLGGAPVNSTLLPCGHYIPDGTFDLSRYNGCPFCGTPFHASDFVFKGQGSRFRTLKGWNKEDIEEHFKNLLTSTVPLSAAQLDNVRLLFDELEMPDVTITQRETLIFVASLLIDKGEEDRGIALLTTPADVLRLLWYRQSGQTQIVRPALLLKKTKENAREMCRGLFAPEIEDAVEAKKNDLRLKYSRTFSHKIAIAINNMDITAVKACEMMHSYRGMWVRVIRALRLAEYARREGFEHLRDILDAFYRKDYTVPQGVVDEALQIPDYDAVVKELSAHPGMFARLLFSIMLKFDPYRVLADFRKVLGRLPLRLVVSLANNAEYYFKNPYDFRTIKDIFGVSKDVPVNPNLKKYSELELGTLAEAVQGLTLDALRLRYALNPQPGEEIYIDPELFNIVLPVGDRTKTREDVETVPQGTTFDVEGDKIRLFLYWGKGMKAAPIDLDLSAAIIYKDKVVINNYTRLTVRGAQHSGDMRAIPDMVGTAEYIELDLPVLREDGAKYVAFTANCYTSGALTPNAMAGWMNSAFPMKIDDKTGVAFDPSCVQHMVKIDDSLLTRGVVFGVLDVVANKVIWLEMPFDGQTVSGLNLVALKGMIYRLSKKLTIGKALETMAEARGMTIVKDKDKITDKVKVYDRQWAYDITAVANLLVPND